MPAFRTQVAFKRVHRSRGQRGSRLGPGGGLQPDRDRRDVGSAAGKPSRRTPTPQGSGTLPGADTYLIHIYQERPNYRVRRF